MRIVQQQRGVIGAVSVEIRVPAGLIPSLHKLHFHFIFGNGGTGFFSLQVVDFKFQILDVMIRIHHKRYRSIFPLRIDRHQFIGMDRFRRECDGRVFFRTDRPDLHECKRCIFHGGFFIGIDRRNQPFRHAQTLEECAVFIHGNVFLCNEFFQFLRQSRTHDFGSPRTAALCHDPVDLCADQCRVFIRKIHPEELIGIDRFIPHLQIGDRTFEAADGIFSGGIFVERRKRSNTIDIYNGIAVHIQAFDFLFQTIHHSDMVPESFIDAECCTQSQIRCHRLYIISGGIHAPDGGVHPHRIVGMSDICIGIHDAVTAEPEGKGVFKSVKFFCDFGGVHCGDRAFQTVEDQCFTAEGTFTDLHCCTGNDYCIARFVLVTFSRFRKFGKIHQRFMIFQLDFVFLFFLCVSNRKYQCESKERNGTAQHFR